MRVSLRSSTGCSSPPSRRRASRWAALAASYDLDVKAVAVAFAFLPAVVDKVAVGLKTKAEVDAAATLIDDVPNVPRALWVQAVHEGLLPNGLLKGLL